MRILCIELEPHSKLKNGTVKLQPQKEYALNWSLRCRTQSQQGLCIPRRDTAVVLDVVETLFDIYYCSLEKARARSLLFPAMYCLPYMEAVDGPEFHLLCVEVTASLALL